MKKILFFLLATALFCFSFDLYHMLYHYFQDQSLWGIPGVPSKFLIKILTLLVPLLLLIRHRIWSRMLLGIGLCLVLSPSWVWASTGCQHARELLKNAGVARDAKENFFGKIKLSPPYGSFPEDMDKVTWWGEFKPFEFWQSPKFQARWIDPEGLEVMRQEFRGEVCALAKTGLKGENQPRGQFKPGIWKVIVTCEDYLIDRQTFAVLPTSPPAGNPGEAQKKAPQEPVMIWAQGKV